MRRTQEKEHQKFMLRCIELAKTAEGLTYPNPMVGSIIVHNNKIIGEGFHRKAGEDHAEVIAIKSVKDKSLLQDSTLYVNLEPCSHYGRTAPCSLLIKESKIPHVVIGSIDPNSKVAGRGVKQLRDAGIKTEIGIMEKESKELNHRFFTFHEHKRPYIILKWAESQDGFIDINREVVEGNRPTWITNELSRRLVHKWRSLEQAILVGSNTALKDNPSLTVRSWSGNNPLRLILDRKDNLPEYLDIFNGGVETFLYCYSPNGADKKVTKICIPNEIPPVNSILKDLYKRNIQSLIVEGGAKLINYFLEAGTWDEARVFYGNVWFKEGIKAPKIKEIPSRKENLGESKLIVFQNNL
ncbi:bifunctional diaminohydroxyphosphoribosylaminopyrimidine deaminase/5-amino-6-(5-phosphoribosylamino)uracil reductase RibD [Marinilabiliaceae bacterium ANBcel2]|nr:bifunctional diaminohydroxyphosphoribosylaminopyrimidine deaminase/5-amino-6-(5-phosphoribosylamino)uracil reductase RibD [Marinilabiliaceae bacterium ANBcel2]